MTAQLVSCRSTLGQGWLHLVFFGIFSIFLTSNWGGVSSSDQQLLDGDLELVNLVLELAALVGGHAGGNDRPGHAAGAAKSSL